MIFDMRPGLNIWENINPAAHGWGCGTRTFYQIPEHKASVAVISKSGCTSVLSSILDRYYPETYATLQTDAEKLGKDPNKEVHKYGYSIMSTIVPSLFTPVALIRDPIDRFISAYLDKSQGGNSISAVPKLGLNDFLIWLCHQSPNLVDDHFRPQWVGLPPDTILLPFNADGIALFERLFDLKLPNLNASVTPPLEVSPAQVDFLKRMYGVDYHYLNTAFSNLNKYAVN